MDMAASSSSVETFGPKRLTSVRFSVTNDAGTDKDTRPVEAAVIDESSREVEVYGIKRSSPENRCPSLLTSMVICIKGGISWVSVLAL